MSLVKKESLADIFNLTVEMIGINDLFSCIENEDAIDEIAKCKNNNIEMRKAIFKNGEYIDKEKLLFVAYLKGREKIKNGYKANQNELREKLKKIETLLKSVSNNISCVDRKYDKNTKLYEKIEIKELKSELNHKKSEKKELEREAEIEKRIKEIEEKITLNELLITHRIDDMAELYVKKDREIGESLKDCISWNCMVKSGIKTPEELLKILEERPDEVSKISNEIKIENVVDELESTIRLNKHLIDFDKLLLTSGKKLEMILETRDLSEDENKAISQSLNVVYDLLKGKNTRIRGKIYRCDVAEQMDVDYKVKDLASTCKRIVQGVYIPKEKEKNIRENLINKNIKTKEVGFAVLKFLNLSKEEKQEICKDEENLMVFAATGLIDNDEIKDILLLNKNNSCGTVTVLYQKKHISEKDIIELYENESIALAEINKLKCAVDFSKLVTEEEIVLRYQNMINDKDNIELKKVYDRYLMLYKEIQLQGKDDKIIQEKSNELIEAFNLQLEEKDLCDLYEAGVITIDSINEWGGKSIVFQLMDESKLHPIDLKKLVKEEKDMILEKIKDVLKNKEMSEENKLALIFSTFSGEENRDIRNNLIQYLNVEEDLKYEKNNKSPNSRKYLSENLDKTRGKEYELDPAERWNLMSMLDKNYTQKMTRDGHCIFILPNINGGKVIIEKLFKIMKDRVDVVYGAGTYILDYEKYKMNESELIDDKTQCMNRKNLIEMRESKDALRIAHTKHWGKILKNTLNIDFENDIEREKNVDECIKRIEDSRMLRE